MKHRLILVGLITTTSLTLFAQNSLKPYYLDNPSSTTQLLSQEQEGFLNFYQKATQEIASGEPVSKFFSVSYAEDITDEQEPLLGKISFDQGEPYNNLCPIVNGKRAVTGCVATAMASVMAYYRFPNNGKGSVTYSGGDAGAQTINLEDYAFKWNDILPHYVYGNYTETQGNAIASLMLACGASLNMQYSADGSGIFTEKVPSALKNNFNFDSNVAHYSTLNYPGDPEELFEYDWEPTIREQTKAGMPIIFAGSPAQGKSGHCFVIDGYKVIDGVYYYHVDWGWNGMANGYFLLTNLNPDGTSYSGYNCTMVCNIKPQGWTSIDNVRPDDAEKLIFNILGQVRAPQERQRGCIYIENGKKYLYY